MAGVRVRSGKLLLCLQSGLMHAEVAFALQKEAQIDHFKIQDIHEDT